MSLDNPKLVCDTDAEDSTANDISNNDASHSTIPKKSIRNFIGFWFLGLCNNYGYVIMLSAAYDLLKPSYHADDGHDEPENQNSTNETLCNPISTGAILLADILPTLFIKSIAPFIILGTHYKVFISVTLSSLSFLITSFSKSHWTTFLGVVCASFSSGLGELTFLSYSTYFDKNVVSTWSSGTGGAGLIGAFSYAILTNLVSPRNALLIMLIIPALESLIFWIVIEHPSSGRLNCQMKICGSELEPMLQNNVDLATKREVNIPRQYTCLEKIALIKPLLKYMIPLGLVYFAEYFINQGLMELLYFRNASSWLTHEHQYRWYQVDYQFGVLISRSSVNLFQINKLWLLPCLQFINLVVLLIDVCYPFIPNIWIVFVIIFYEGLLGGGAYVNTFYKISSEVSAEDKEFSMGIASLADSMGIAAAGAISVPVHDALCKTLSRPL